MAETFFRLSPDAQLEVLETAAEASDRRPDSLEKDIWVVWAISKLFAAPFGKHLVFKGGTSLSKGYQAIQRFSEDIDLTYDIRKLIPDTIGDRECILPPTRSQEKKWTREVRMQLAKWIGSTVVPLLDRAIKRDDLPAKIRLGGKENEKVFVDYEPLVTGSGYIGPPVILEFGGRSTGEPCQPRGIVCDIAEFQKSLVFPVATPRTMRIERTIWEKATAVHVYCLQGRARGERLSRHWHDLAQLDKSGYVEKALQNRELAMEVARHKSVFFRERDSKGTIDYERAVCGELVLVPDGKAFEAIEEDYYCMADGDMLLKEPEKFEDIMDRCREIEQKANNC